MCSLILWNPIYMIKLHQSRHISTGMRKFLLFLFLPQLRDLSIWYPSRDKSNIYHVKARVLIPLYNKMSFRAGAASDSFSVPYSQTFLSRGHRSWNSPTLPVQGSGTPCALRAQPISLPLSLRCWGFPEMKDPRLLCLDFFPPLYPQHRLNPLVSILHSSRALAVTLRHPDLIGCSLPMCLSLRILGEG